MRLPSPAMVVALIALIVAMSGSAYAVTQLPRNSVGAAQLKKNAVTAVKLKNNTVTSAKIKNGTIQVADLSAQARTELKGATGATGPAGPRGEQGPPGAQTSAFFVNANEVPIEGISGSTAVIDDFVIITPQAGYLAIDLDLYAQADTVGGEICGDLAPIDVTVSLNGTALPDLGGVTNGGIDYSATTLVEVGVGTQSIVMRLECMDGETPAPTTRSWWYASGALYPVQLTATTATG